MVKRTGPELRTERLLLRRWQKTDLEPFAALNADEEVMEHFPRVLTRDESDAFASAIEAHFEQHGFGWWAVEVEGDDAFIGFVGLRRVPFEAHFTPAVEIGWRLARKHWGHGYASEAARAAVSFGFEEIGLDEIVSFTTPENLRSRAVMARLGMSHNAVDDFDHPRARCRMVLYRLPRRP